ncbi:MAG: tryptophan synthase subunit alpha [Thermoanaerobaculia bacterium]|nr:tryptophan synthase subunit alpha [Thermoanaerobaculia bacterium]
MSAIARVFDRCRDEKRAAFIPFLTAGDPDLRKTADLMQAFVDGGADIIELGVPFSDPVADGPVIQEASQRALSSGTTLSAILRLVARQRDRLGVPIVLFTYFNPIHARGVENFAEQAAASGVDAVLCVDLPPDEATEDVVPMLRKQGLDTVFLVAPTSDKQRIKTVNAMSSGFVYYVSRTGVTGARRELPKELIREVKKLRRRIDLPLAVGFGISTPEQVEQVARVAEGVVVGSALVKLIGDHAEAPDLAKKVESKIRELVTPLGR